MPSTSRGWLALLGVVLVAAAGWPQHARAEQQAEGFAVERFHPAPPGGGWLLMDELRLSGGLGGAVSLALGYARNPLQVGGADRRLRVVSDQAFAEVGLAVIFDRFRFSMSLAGPLIIAGESGAAFGYRFTAPTANLEQNPDTVSDPQIGFTARILGEPDGTFRLGASAQIFIPSGARADYLTDGTYRAMGRILLAGASGRLTWAGALGVHLRPRDDGPVPGGPRGSELIFGAAGGTRIPVGAAALVVGPELFGETALKSWWGSQTTGLEALLGARLEGMRSDNAGYRVKLGIGAGVGARFGAPAFRIVAGVELFGHAKGAIQ